jgi:hypothetical protein
VICGAPDVVGEEPPLPPGAHAARPNRAARVKVNKIVFKAEKTSRFEYTAIGGLGVPTAGHGPQGRDTSEQRVGARRLQASALEQRRAIGLVTARIGTQTPAVKLCENAEQH